MVISLRSVLSSGETASGASECNWPRLCRVQPLTTPTRTSVKRAACVTGYPPFAYVVLFMNPIDHPHGWWCKPYIGWFVTLLRLGQAHKGVQKTRNKNKAIQQGLIPTRSRHAREGALIVSRGQVWKVLFC